VLCSFLHDHDVRSTCYSLSSLGARTQDNCAAPASASIRHEKAAGRIVQKRREIQLKLHSSGYVQCFFIPFDRLRNMIRAHRMLPKFTTAVRSERPNSSIVLRS
jgi:hypothetical protein